MKKMILFTIISMVFFKINAQPLTGIKTIGPGGDYLSLTAVFAAINNNGLGGPVVLSLLPGYQSTYEVFPLTPPSIGTDVNTITLRPAAVGLSVVSSNAGPTFHLNGSKYFTIDGRIGGEGDGKDLIISNTATNQGCGLKFSNDACHNTLRYCKLKGVNTSVSSGGVVIFAGSTGQTGNDNNLIEHCDLGDGVSTPSNMIISTGSSGKDNSGNTISHCNIFNYISSGAQCSGIYFPSPSYNNNWIIDGNSFYQTSPRTYNGNFYAICSEGSANGNITVSNNFIGGQSAFCQGEGMNLSGALSFRAIRLTIHQSATAIINNNIIRNINLTTSSQSQAASAVSMVSGSFFCHNNLVSDIHYISSGNGSCFSALNAGTGSPVNIDIGYNIIKSIHISGNSNCSLRGITIASPNPYNAQATEIIVHDNTIGIQDSGLTSNLNGTVLGIISQSACTNQTISMNTIQCLQAFSNGPGDQVIGISTMGNNGGGFSVTGNVVRHCTSNSSSSGNNALSSIIGISCTANSTPGHLIDGNTISSLVNNNVTSSPGICGIYYDGPVTGDNKIQNNIINSLSLQTMAVSALIQGITINSANTSGSLKVWNNMIYLGHDSVGNEISPSAGIYGIYKINGNMSAVHNTICIDGISSDNTQATAAFRKLNSNTDTLVNNILVNKRSCESLDTIIKHYGGFFNNTTGMFCDGNDYDASGLAGRIATCDNGNASVSTIQELQQVWPGNNMNSIKVTPVFVNNNGYAGIADLHLTAGNNCFINSIGIYYPGSISDIDGESRDQQHPDPGADEIEAEYPVAPVTGNSVRVCEGEPIPSMYATGSGLIKWYLDSTLSVLGHRGDTFNCTGCLPGLRFYYVTDSLSGCESHPVTMFLMIDTTGSAGHVSGDTVLCYGQQSGELLLSGYTGHIMKWQYREVEDTAWVDLMDTSQVLSPGILTSSRMYRAFVKNGVCQEIISDTATVAIAEAVVTFETVLPPFCVNETPITLQGGSPLGGTYSGPGVSGNSFSPAEAGVGYHEIFYTWTDAYGCLSKDSSSIQVLNIPQVSIGDTLMYCCVNGSIVTLDGGFPEGGQYSGQGVSEGYFYPVIAGQGDHNITYYYSDDNNCSSSATAVMKVYGAPAVYSLTGQASYCQGYGGTTLLLNGSDTGIMYQLFRNDSIMGCLLPGSGDTLRWQNLNYGIYRVVAVNNDNGCSSNMGGVLTVSENILPQAFTVEGIPHYCHVTTGSMVALNGSQQGVSYQLIKNGIDEGMPVMGTGETLVWDERTEGVYTIRATMISNGCSSDMIGNITIAQDQDFTVSIFPNPAYISVDSVLALITLPEGGYPPYANDQWIGEYIELLSGTSVGNPVFESSLAGDFSFEYFLMDSHQCIAQNSVIIHVTSAVMPSFIEGKIRCGEGSVVMQATAGTGGDAVQFSLNGTDVAFTDTSEPYEYLTPVLEPGENITVYTRTFNTLTGLYSTWTSAVATAVSVASGGSLTSSDTICIGNATPMLYLSGQDGEIAHWERRLNDGDWENLAIIADHHQETPETQGLWQYRVETSVEGCQPVFSDTVAVLVNEPATGGVLSINQGVICQGESTGNLLLSGYTGNIWSWRKRINGTAWQTIENNTESYNENPTLNGVWEYQVITMKEGCGQSQSSIAEIEVIASSQGGILTGGGSICSGSMCPLMSLSGYNGQIVKWQKKCGNGLWEDISCQIPQYSEIINQQGDWSFWAVIRNGDCQPVLSTQVSVTVFPLPVGGQVSGSTNICLGSQAVWLYLDGYEGNILKWQKKQGAGAWTDIPCHLAWYHASPSASGLWFYRAVINRGSCGIAYSETAQIMVYIPPLGGMVSGSKDICQGSSTETLHAIGFEGIINKWQKQRNNEGWTDIYSISSQYSEIITQPGIWRYRVVIGNGCCNHAYSEPAVILVTQSPAGGTLIGGGVICQGDSIAELTISGYNGRLKGWQKRYNNITWVDINDTSQHYSEMPPVAGPWEYRAVVGNDNCEEVFSNSVFVEVIALPVQFALMEVGSFCEGEAGGILKLEGSQTGIAYQLMKNDTSFGLPKQGNGTSLSWHGVPPGIYSVYAINSQYFCTSLMKGNINIVERPMPVIFALTGGGYDCSGKGGGVVTLLESEMGISYHLIKNDSLDESVLSGNGQALQWIDLTEGMYSVQAVNTGSSCSVMMTGTVTVSLVNEPQSFTLTGGGVICSNDSVTIGLSGSQQEIQYHLLLDGFSLEGTEVTGNGQPLDLGYFHEPGEYTVIAIDNQHSCEVGFYESVSINCLPVPEVFAGGEIYACYGSSLEIPAAFSGGTSPYSLLWSPGTGLSCDTIINPVVNLYDTLHYTLMLTDGNDCKVSDNVILYPVLPVGHSVLNGHLTYSNIYHTALRNVPVYLITLQGDTINEVITDSTGYYNFPFFPDGEYWITASSDKVTGGVNTTDALLALREYVQMSHLNGIHKLAADVDGSNFVNAVDALSIQRYFIGYFNSFPAGEWVFEKKLINFQGTIKTLDLKGLCYGDVNGSYTPGY